MSWSLIRVASSLVILAVVPTFLLATAPPLKIAANDNRSTAGELRDDTLRLSLDLREGQWHPESEEGRALTVYAFGETGKGLQNPGPLIRVRQGTEIYVTLHNALPVAATVHGLHERPGSEKDFLTLQPGGTQDVRFKAGAPGTYYYWASTTDSAVDRRMPIDSQLAGAFIVDTPGAVPTDRIFVIGVWYKEVPFRLGAAQLATINGKSWPIQNASRSSRARRSAGDG